MRRAFAIGLGLGIGLLSGLASGQRVPAAEGSSGTHARPWDVGRALVEQDRRLTVTRETNTVFEPRTFATREAWEAYAERLRFRIRVACGLWPEPERTPLNARVFDPIERDDYIIFKVHFEAFPGFLVTGNLYTPKGVGPYPAVLCPHGHWELGRFEDSERASVAARCITFARMGIVAFSYDMVGYNDSRQFPKAWGHDWDAVPRHERRMQELWGIHPFGIQLWSSIRALDFLESLPEVDRDRLACTGASGGGTQTFALYAVDDRVKVAAPVNMISHRMQGGDACENAPLIRFDATNVEIGALMAPKPLLMVSATGDWTRDTPEVEYPAIQRVYGLYGAEDRVENVHIDAPHNYNRRAREAVYRFFGKWLLNEPKKYAAFTEPAYTMEPVEALRVFPGEGVPEGYPDADDVIEALMRSRAERARGIAGGSGMGETPMPRMSRSTAEVTHEQPFFEAYREAVCDALGVDAANSLKVLGEQLDSTPREGYRVERWVLRVPETGAVIPTVLLVPDQRRAREPALFVHPDGKAAYFAESDWSPVGRLRKACVDDARLVAAIDVFRRGEMAGLEREGAKYSDTFAPTDAAYRVQDVLAAITWLRERANGTVAARGTGEAAGWCALATAVANGQAETAVELGTMGSSPTSWVDEHYIPCLASLGGLWPVMTELGRDTIEIFRNDTVYLP